MAYRVTCRDCSFVSVVYSEDEARKGAHDNRAKTGHRHIE